MKPVILVTACALAAAAITAPAVRAQEGSPDGAFDDPEAIEHADAGSMMHGDMGGPGPGMHGMHGFGGRRGMRGSHGFGGLGFGMRLEAIEELDLTDAQRDRLAEIREQHMKAAIPVEGDLRLARLDLGKLLRADKPEAGAVERQIDRISELRGTLMKNHVTGMIEARAVLTPAQQKKLRDLRREGPHREGAKRSR